MDCPALQDWSNDAVDAFGNYRITIAIFAFLFFNVYSGLIQSSFLPRNAAYSQMNDKDKEMLTIRTMQFTLGLIIAITGYSAALVDLISGCRFVLKPWAFWAGGGILTLFDFHEFGARWPLPSHVLVHHIAVFTIALFYIEFSVLDEIQFPTVIFIANIGFCWITDYAHVIFRTSVRLTHIRRARLAYLVLSPPVRVLNICLLSASTVLAVISREWLLFGVNLFMAFAYFYNTYRAVTFVIKFDCIKYYEKHQKIWLGRNHSLQPSKPDPRSVSDTLKASFTKAWVQSNDFFDDNVTPDVDDDMSLEQEEFLEDDSLKA